ncbi:MAG TPA: 1,2-phenylacetyl-CoA epoxidase subunit PaaC, partial [Arthrobacter sp.]|nr:1,2-phenylacetyl-CoA epoxidase subunit PaaC [Arthrobacter sp.]
MSTSPETAAASAPAAETGGHGDISVGVKGSGNSGEATASATRITPGNALRPEDIALAVSRGTAKPSEDAAEFALRLGDDALVLAQRLGHWISRAPELEEVIALGNIALDQLGHARSFLSYAGGLDGRSEDDLAYFRREPEFRSVEIFELPNGDFAVTIARQFVVSYYQFELYRRLMESSDATLAGIAAKAVKEVDYHRDHSAQWVLRLGDDALVLAQRLGHWISRAPELEDDIALGNIALDQLGHARSFLSYAGGLDGRSEDDLAYFRREPEFRSVEIFELPNCDFAVTIARQFVVSY